MNETKRFKIEHAKTYRSFRWLLLKLKLAKHQVSLREIVDMCERVGYCRFKDDHEKYNNPCIHY